MAEIRPFNLALLGNSNLATFNSAEVRISKILKRKASYSQLIVETGRKISKSNARGKVCMAKVKYGCTVTLQLSYSSKAPHFEGPRKEPVAGKTRGKRPVQGFTSTFDRQRKLGNQVLTDAIGSMARVVTRIRVRYLLHLHHWTGN